MNALQIVLRLLHILLGIFWVGGVLFVAVFLGPAVRDAGPEGGKVMAALGKRGVPKIMPIVGLVTILSGLWLYSRDSVGFNSGYIKSPTGMTFGIGGLLAILGLAFGAVVLAPTFKRISDMAQSPPADPAARDAHTAELQKLRAKFAKGSNLVAVTLALAAACMAIARYV